MAEEEQNELFHKSLSGKYRARYYKFPFNGTPGKYNSITDVAGVEVGYCTIIEGEGKLETGKGPIRTGVTAIHPRGKENSLVPLYAGYFSYNGNGEFTGSAWIDECGIYQGPILLTNTHSVGIARDAGIKWLYERNKNSVNTDWSLPIATETYDGELNDMNGFHVKEHHVFEALNIAQGGLIDLGSVGGGTGMLTYDFKGGCGSASRVVKSEAGEFTVGVFVQSNFGIRRELVIGGIPMGAHMTGGEIRSKPMGSLIVVIITDAPMNSSQLKRMAKRAAIGMGNTGAICHHGSGDIFIALSTANGEVLSSKDWIVSPNFLQDSYILDSFFEAVVEATYESIIDAMVSNEAMTGCNDIHARHIPVDKVVEVLKAHNRI